MLARFIRLTDIMQEFGHDIGMPLKDLQLAQLRMKEVKKNVT